MSAAVQAVLPGIIVGLVLAAWDRRQKCRDQADRDRETERVKSELLRISLLVSTAQLSYAVAMAIKRGRPNGEIEEGMAQYERAMSRFRCFEQEQLARTGAEQP